RLGAWGVSKGEARKRWCGEKHSESEGKLESGRQIRASARRRTRQTPGRKRRARSTCKAGRPPEERALLSKAVRKASQLTIRRRYLKPVPQCALFPAATLGPTSTAILNTARDASSSMATSAGHLFPTHFPATSVSICGAYNTFRIL